MFRGGFIRRAARVARLQNAARRMGQEMQFCGALHWRDHLMHHVLTTLQNEDGYEFGLREYFEQGARDAAQVRAVMSGLGHNSNAKVLEFAAGYGRVTRHLRLADLTTTDIHRGAVSFLISKLGVRAVQSTHQPSEFQLQERYDFIFVLSLFSHLPDSVFGAWLAKLYFLLAPGGHLMFTTNCETAVSKVPRMAEAPPSENGLSFLPDTDQPDLATSTYGTTIVTSDYVRRQIREKTSGYILSHKPGAWWGTQDEWTVQKALLGASHCRSLIDLCIP